MFYYYWGMPDTMSISGLNVLDSVRQLAPRAHAGAVYLLSGDPRTLSVAMQELINRFALRGPVRVVLGNNHINLDMVLLMLGDQAGRAYAVLDNLLISRAETCYQMKDVLAHLEPDPSPVIVTELLATFNEKELTRSEVHVLVQHCIDSLHRISQSAPVLISAQSVAEHPDLLPLLEQGINSRLQFEPPQKLAGQLQTSLF